MREGHFSGRLNKAKLDLTRVMSKMDSYDSRRISINESGCIVFPLQIKTRESLSEMAIMPMRMPVAMTLNDVAAKKKTGWLSVIRTRISRSTDPGAIVDRLDKMMWTSTGMMVRNQDVFGSCKVVRRKGTIDHQRFRWHG